MNLISDEILQRVTGQIVIGQAVLVAYDLGIFKLLSKGPLSIKHISDNLKIKDRAAQALVSCCCAMELLESNESLHYQLSPIGERFLNEQSST
jgi:predicted transcriptional regulator